MKLLSLCFVVFLAFSVRPYCTVRPYSTAILGFLGTAVRVRVRPKIIAVRRTILSLQFLMIFSVLQTGSLGFWVTFFNLSTSLSYNHSDKGTGMVQAVLY